MKFFIMTAALLLAAPASLAGQLLPNLYARQYCSLRDIGVNNAEARAAAIATSYVHSLPDLPKVTIGVKQYDTDVVQAFRAVQSKCPQHLVN
jgi:hypothetical protein